jgi:hypothetical protein
MRFSGQLFSCALLAVLLCITCISCSKGQSKSGGLNIPAPNPAEKIYFDKVQDRERLAVAYNQSLPAGWPPKLKPPANCLMAEGIGASKTMHFCAEVDAAALSKYFQDECARLGLKPNAIDMQVKSHTATATFIQFKYNNTRSTILIFPQDGGLHSEPEGRARSFVRFAFIEGI